MQKVAKRGRKWLIPGLVVIVLLVIVVMATRGKRAEPEHQAEEAAITVKTVTLSSSEIPGEVTASGTVRPATEAQVAPKIMSNVTAVYVQEGDRVSRGQVIARLESRDLQAQVAQAQAAVNAASAGSGRAYTAIDLQKAQTSTGIASAQAALKAAQEQLSLVKAGPRKQQRAQAHFAVAQAEAQLKNAQIELDRMQRLYDQDVIPKQRLDSTQMAYDIAKAQFESAKEQANLTEEGSRTQDISAAQQQVRQAEENLRMAKASIIQNRMSVSNAKVAASGVNQARAALQFARTQLAYATITAPTSGVVSARMVDPGDTVSPGIPMISIQADSNYRLEVTVPDSAAGSMSVGKSVNVIIGAAERTAVGKVALISPAGDAGSHKFLVKVDLPASLKARSGEFGRISFAVGKSQGVIVPEAAIHNEGGLSSVFIVDSQDRVRMRPVKFGRKTDGGLEAVSGLRAGERVIVENSGVLTDGALARVEGQ